MNTHTNISPITTASTLTPAPAIRAYLGGSFDPVHNGHMQMAMYVYNCLASLAVQQQRALQVSLLPNARSPFKQNSTAANHRLAMLQLAIQDTPLHISEIELWQKPPVYTINSVRALQQRYPNDSLIFIMGMDSARSLEQWKDGLQLTDYVHLWIFDRSDHANDLPTQQAHNTSFMSQNLSAQDVTALYTELPVELQAQITKNSIDLTQPLNSDAEDSTKNHTTDRKPLSSIALLQNDAPLKSTTQGRIYIDPRPVTTVSSTYIRQQINIQQPLNQQRHKPRPTDAITANNPPNSLAKLLNPTVYHYIIAHQLYSAAQFR